MNCEITSITTDEGKHKTVLFAQIMLRVIVYDRCFFSPIYYRHAQQFSTAITSSWSHNREGV